MGEVLNGNFTSSHNSRFPWNPWGEHKETLFYCHRLGLDDLTLTPDVLGGDSSDAVMYHCISKSDATKRVYPIRAWEIVPAEAKEAKIAQENSEGLFEINLANIIQIKDFLITKFIPSYNWESDEQKASMLAAAKRARDGLHRDIEKVRLQGSFLNKEDFTVRLKAENEAFPWDKLADFLGYQLPST